MGKKIRAEMETQRKTFIDGAMARGITEAKAGEIFDLMAKFADYGFNKSHAAAYALVAYQTAWMRANHPAVFLAACMSLAIDNTDRLAALRQEAGQLDIAVLPPDINRSGTDFTVERQPDGALAIRYALAAVKKVGFAAMQALVAARGERLFADLADFAARVDPRQLNRMQTREPDAGRRLRCAVRATERGFMLLPKPCCAARRRRWKSATSGQIGLFGGGATMWPTALARHAGLAADGAARLRGGGDRLSPDRAPARCLCKGAAPARRGAEQPTRDPRAAGAVRLKLAGSVVGCKQRLTRSGSPMAWLRLSDGGGSYEVTLFSEVLARSRDMLQEGNTVLVTAGIRLEGETLRITAQDVAPLDQMAADAAAGMRIWLERTEAVPHIRAMPRRRDEREGAGGVDPTPRPPQEVEIALAGRVQRHPAAHPGVADGARGRAGRGDVIQFLAMPDARPSFPRKREIHRCCPLAIGRSSARSRRWIPACAGMTNGGCHEFFYLRTLVKRRRASDLRPVASHRGKG